MEEDLLEEYRYPTMFGEAEVFTLLDEDDSEDEEGAGKATIERCEEQTRQNTPFACAEKKDTPISCKNPTADVCSTSASEQVGTPLRVLYVGGGFQSATYLGERRFEPVFEYYRAFDHLFESARNIKKMLMIGGGAFSYPKHLLTSREKVSIDVVEIDPAIVEIARKHFYLDELESSQGNRLRTIVADGVSFLADAPSCTYDAIINDSFDGTNPTEALLSAQSLANAKRCLTQGGLYLLNVVVDAEIQNADDIVGATMRKLSEHFSCVYEIPCIDLEFSGADNYLLIATDEPCAFTGVQSALLS